MIDAQNSAGIEKNVGEVEENVKAALQEMGKDCGNC